jgi:cytochrome c oxidase cbb3-type subunit 3
VRRIETESYDQILADDGAMRTVRETGRVLFGDNCAACHGADGKGGKGFPNLAQAPWLWGGTPDEIAKTVQFGINASHPDTRVSQMPAFGRDGMLDPGQVDNVAAYVYSLSHPDYSTPERIKQIEAGRQVFLTTCAACHGQDAKGNQEVGAPNLTDNYWIYGGDIGTIITTIHGGREGHMPTWDERLTPAQIKILATYVYSLGVENP